MSPTKAAEPDGPPDCPPYFGQANRGKGKGKGRGYHGSGAFYDRNGCEIAPPSAPSIKLSKKSKKSKTGIAEKNSKKISASRKASGKKKKVHSSKGKKN
jgi:hypothetical protein